MKEIKIEDLKEFLADRSNWDVVIDALPVGLYQCIHDSVEKKERKEAIQQYMANEENVFANKEIVFSEEEMDIIVNYMDSLSKRSEAYQDTYQSLISKAIGYALEVRYTKLNKSN